MNEQYFLSRGAHEKAADGRCAMEWVSYLAGEKHSDHPVCVSPVLTRFCIAFNDRLPDAERQKLRPYLARTIGTKGDGLDKQRVALCREWLLHTALPHYLDAAGRVEAAQRLRDLPTDLGVESVRKTISAARDEAWEARREARANLERRVRVELARRGLSAAAAAAAAAAADAVVDAVAVAAAAAAAAVDADYGSVYRAVYDRCLAKVREPNEPLLPGAFKLLDQMLPTEIIQLPVAADAEAVCGVAVQR